MGLCLHKGAKSVSVDQLFDVQTPAPTETHYPLPHHVVRDTVVNHILDSGLDIEDEHHGLWSPKGGTGNDRYFGLFNIIGDTDDFRFVVGVRNSHDKRFSAGACSGSRVFVCDNLAFSGEHVLKRKHTRFVEQDFTQLVRDLPLRQLADGETKRIAAYKETELTDVQLHDLAIRSVDDGVLPASKLPELLTQWRTPNHPEFRDRNVWSAFNAYTEVLKGTSLERLSGRTQRLHSLVLPLCQSA